MNTFGRFDRRIGDPPKSKTIKQTGLSEEEKDKSLKGIVGCEYFVCDDHLNKSQKDNGYQIVLLAKNKKG